MTATSCWSPTTSPPPSRRAASPTTRACARPWGEPASRGRRGSRSSRMSEPGRPSRRGRNSRGRPSPASLGLVKVGADFEDEYPGADRTCTEAYASLCRTGEALLGELDRRVRLTFGIPQAAATALAVIDGAGAPLTPSQVSDRVLIASATMTATLDLLEQRGWIRRVANPGDRRSTLIEITPDGRAVTDQLLPGIRTLEKSILSALTAGEHAPAGPARQDPLPGAAGPQLSRGAAARSRLAEASRQLSCTASRPFESSVLGSPLMKEILVWLVVALIASVNSFHACLWLVGCSEFTAVSFLTPFTSTSTVLLTPKIPPGSLMLPSQ